MDDRDEGWLEPDDMMGLWEHQGRPLLAGALESALADVEGDVPIEIEYFDGADVRRLRAMHVDLRGKDGRPTSVVITVA